MLDDIYNLTLKDPAREIRRLKKAGVIPKKTPRLGQYLNQYQGGMCISGVLKTT